MVTTSALMGTGWSANASRSSSSPPPRRALVRERDIASAATAAIAAAPLQRLVGNVRVASA
jgi:hypothetical protein